MKATTKNGERRTDLIKKVLQLRDGKGLSWTAIKLALREGKNGVVVSGSTVRRMYDEGHGEKGAHYASRPLSGGRYRNDENPNATKPSGRKSATAKKSSTSKTAGTKKASAGTSKRTSRSTKSAEPKAARKVVKKAS